VAYGGNVILHDLSFTINRGDIFIIMGESGGGKSTVLRSMVGLLQPAKGHILYDGESFWSVGPEEQKGILRKFGILYQSGALWSSLTLAENVALPLQEYTDLRPGQMSELVSLKLSLDGLSGFEDNNPTEISGGMKKRAGLARAMALDPEILFR
jgi:phospholipid/cholesterol/gamma-HCH transport system ATP-binding protein